MRALILKVYYPSFHDLLRFGNTDTIREFCTYVDLRNGRLPSATELKAALAAYGGMPPSGDASSQPAVLKVAEEAFPPIFRDLARQREFVDFLTPLNNADDRRELRKAVGSRALQSDVSGTSEPYVAPDSSTTGALRLLWIHDDPDTVKGVLRKLETAVSRLTIVRTRTGLVDALQRADYDVVISNVERFGDPDAGFDDMEYLRREHLFEGPIIFFVGRVDRNREALALSLGAHGMVNRYDQIMSLLTRLAKHHPPQPSPGPAPRFPADHPTEPSVS
jgi:hypothetical protein